MLIGCMVNHRFCCAPTGVNLPIGYGRDVSTSYSRNWNRLTSSRKSTLTAIDSRQHRLLNLRRLLLPPAEFRNGFQVDITRMLERDIESSTLWTFLLFLSRSKRSRIFIRNDNPNMLGLIVPDGEFDRREEILRPSYAPASNEGLNEGSNSAAHRSITSRNRRIGSLAGPLSFGGGFRPGVSRMTGTISTS